MRRKSQDIESFVAYYLDQYRIQLEQKQGKGIKLNTKAVCVIVAKHCNISIDSVWGYIKKDYNLPSLEVALKMSELFGVSVNDLFRVRK